MDQVIAVVRKADAFCFDVDSTVIVQEGIDELAKFCGKRKEIVELTEKAMEGAMTFEESLAIRLNILQPSKSTIDRFVSTVPITFSPGIKDLIALLRERNVAVYLLSGGFHYLIGKVAEKLDIPDENVYSNKMKFFYDGKYAGFDETQPTSRSGGKTEVVNILKEKYGYKNLVLVGDGATDLEAAPAADAFIGYGGNIVRENVQRKAKWFIKDFQEIIDVLKKSY